MVPAEERLPRFLQLLLGPDVHNIYLAELKPRIILPGTGHQIHSLNVGGWGTITKYRQHVSPIKEPLETLPFICNEWVCVVVLVLNWV